MGLLWVWRGQGSAGKRRGQTSSSNFFSNLGFGSRVEGGRGTCSQYEMKPVKAVIQTGKLKKTLR